MNNSDIKQITIVIKSGLDKVTETNKIKTNNGKLNHVTKHIFDETDDPYYEEYPYFTTFMKIPKDVLKRMNFREKIRFFFNRRSFLDTLNKYSEDLQYVNGTFDENVNYNIVTMIELLFTTVYPTINDNRNSFNKYVLQRSSYSITMDGSVPSIFTKFVPYLDVDFSYIKLDGKYYTVTSTCILNDILNHPTYNNLIDKLTSFNKWKNSKRVKNELDINKIINQIYFHIDDRYVDIKQVTRELERNSLRSSSRTNNESKAHNLNILFDTLRKNKKKIAMNLSLTTDTLKQIKSEIEGRTFNELLKLIDEYLLIMIINVNYFNPSGNRQQVTTKDVEQYLKSNFKEFSEIHNDISKVVSPNCLTSNKKLQSMINDYYSNKNDVFERYMVYLYDKYINDDKPIVVFPNELITLYGFNDVTDSMYTGINHYNLDKINVFEAYVSFDLILGKLTSDDLSNISCEFQNNQLGDMVSKHQYEVRNMFLTPKPTIINIDDMILKGKDGKNNMNDKKGGRRKYSRISNKKIKRKKNKTMKRVK